MDTDLEQQLSAWMKRAQEGDRTSYEALLTKVAELLRGFIRKQVAQEEWVEDIVQEALFSIHQDRHTYDPSRKFSSWMYAIAQHRMIDYARQQRRRREQLGATGQELDGILQHTASTTLSEKLLLALKRLSSKQREIIQLLKLGGFSVKEVSQRTGMSESSIKVSAHRGYKNLRRLLENTSDED